MNRLKKAIKTIKGMNSEQFEDFIIRVGPTYKKLDDAKSTKLKTLCDGVGSGKGIK